MRRLLIFCFNSCDASDINLNNESGRKQAYDIVQKIENQEKYVAGPVNITAVKANEVIQELKYYIQQLNILVGSDKPKRDTSVYFNWIKGENE